MIAFYAGGNSLAGTAHGDSLWLFSLDGRIGPVAPGAASRAIEHAGEAGTGEVEEEATTIEPDADRVTESDEGGGATAVVDGAQIFSDDCSVCHGADGTGGNGGPDLTAIPSARDLRAVERQVADGGGGMPAFRGQLSPEEIRAVSVYVTRLVR